MSSIPRAGDPAPTPMLVTALDCHARGWCIIPAKGKQACASWKRYQSQRPTEAQLRRWFANGTVKNLAIVLGEASGHLICRDFDETDSYMAWSKAHPELAKSLPTAWTARGRHVYCRTTPERIAAFSKAYVDLGDGELRLSSCYCVLPPSIHPNGLPYRWVIPPTSDVPLVDDLEAAGLTRNWSAHDSGSTVAARSRTAMAGRLTEHTEHTEQTEHTEAYGADVCTLKQTDAINTAAMFAKNANTAGGWKEAVNRAIQETQPKGPGQRNRCLFQLVRLLKAIPEVAVRPGMDLERVVKRWYTLALPKIRTEDYYVTLSEFLTAWDNVQYPEGCDPIAVVLAEVDREEPPKCAERFNDPRMQRLIAVCRVLQRHAGDGEFYLSCRRAAEVIERSHELAAIWLRLLEQVGIIHTVLKGDRESRRASRYRYLGD